MHFRSVQHWLLVAVALASGGAACHLARSAAALSAEPSALVVRVIPPSEDPTRAGPVRVQARRLSARADEPPLATEQSHVGVSITLRPLPAGPVRIEVRAPGFDGEFPVTVRGGCADTLTLVLPQALMLSDGPPVEGTWRTSGCAPGA